MRLVIIESPLGTKPDGSRCTAEEMAENQRYARACVLDSYKRGEAPAASHVFGPCVLDDTDPEQRRMGMETGFAWADAVAAANRANLLDDVPIAAVYVDRGITGGMREGFARHHRNGVELEWRRLASEWGPELWAVHVLGPDTIFAMPDRATAEQRAAEWNDMFKTMLSRDASPNDPKLEAVVEPYPYAAATHAEALAEHGGNPKELC